METLIRNAAIAWNPIGATRTRMLDGTLNVGSVLLPFISVVIACNFVAVSAQLFFQDSLLFALGQPPVSHPVLSDFSRKALSALGPIIPAVAVALLPSRIFGSAGRTAVVAAIFIVAAAWSFYGAAAGSPVWYVAGILASVDPLLGAKVMLFLQIPVGLFIVVLVFWFWFRVFRTVLALPAFSVAVITVVAFGSIAATFVLAFLAGQAIFGV